MLLPVVNLIASCNMCSTVSYTIGGYNYIAKVVAALLEYVDHVLTINDITIHDSLGFFTPIPSKFEGSIPPTPANALA